MASKLNEHAPRTDLRLRDQHRLKLDAGAHTAIDTADTTIGHTGLDRSTLTHIAAWADVHLGASRPVDTAIGGGPLPRELSSLRIPTGYQPTPLDLRIRELEHEVHHSAAARADLLGALIDSLMSSARTTALTSVATPARFSGTPLSVQVTEVVDPEWDPKNAHEQVSDLVVRLGFGPGNRAIRDEIIRTCVPFLQPDSSMVEALNREELIVQILVTRAGLMQILATERPLLPIDDRQPPPPSALHYTAKLSLTEAFVSGRAGRAVCGQWWVPIGDDSTHSALPICPEREEESPFAQAACDLLMRLTERPD